MKGNSPRSRILAAASHCPTAAPARREEFLKTVDAIIPWDEWVEQLHRIIPAASAAFRPGDRADAAGCICRGIRFNLSDPATENAIYASYAIRKFVGIDFMTENVPNGTTFCRFRNLLEKNGLNKRFFDAARRVIVAAGHMMKGGTVVDATVINAPSSTKNAGKAHGPEMYQMKKENGWRFGRMRHIGADDSRLVHTIEVTAADEHDVAAAPKLIREDDEVVYGDSGYPGVQKRPEVRDDAHLSAVDFRINRCPRNPPEFPTISSIGSG